MADYKKDNDLNPIIENADDNDLLPLVEYMRKKLSNNIDTNGKYLLHPNNPTMYTDLIADEIRRFGGNTFANILRGEGVAYKEIVCDVAKKLKVKFNKNSSIEKIEQKIILKIFADALDKMSSEERKEVLDDINASIKSEKLPLGSSSAMIIQALIKMGGFAPYQMAVIVANSIARAVLGSGLSLATNAAITKGLSIFVGPIGWVISGIWMTIDIAGPSYKTTIPCVVHIAMLRQKQKNNII